MATLPGDGAPTRSLIVNTHTDGQNALEENAGIACVELAEHYAALPQSARKRTLVFSGVTGDASGGGEPKTEGFIDDDPDVIARAAAAIRAQPSSTVPSARWTGPPWASISTSPRTTTSAPNVTSPRTTSRVQLAQRRRARGDARLEVADELEVLGVEVDERRRAVALGASTTRPSSVDLVGVGAQREQVVGRLDRREARRAARAAPARPR